MDSMYSLNGSLESNRYAGYNFDPTPRSPVPPNAGSNTTGSTALYHHNGTRYGLGLPVRAGAPAENKLNGLHGGPKHKRGDVDRECMSSFANHNVVLMSCSIKSTVLLVPASKIFKEKYHLFAEINMGAGICKRNWRKVWPNIET